MKILLASQSPRRKELLQQLDYDFETVSVDCDEVYPAETKPENVAGYLSKLKASAFRELSEDEVLITADTVVVLDGEILGKPSNDEEAADMLRKLSGRNHQVFTGITIKTHHTEVTKTDRAEVEFMELSAADIKHYVQKYRPLDKAGSYGIQEWIGMAKVSRINGSFYTIMGLPTHLVAEELSAIESKYSADF